MQYGVVPSQIISALRGTHLLQLYPLLTSMFIHAGVVHIFSVGASAAISGVLGAYLLFFPRARVVSLVVYFVLPIRAYWFILAWFFLQLFYYFTGINTGVAYGAHVGGFIVGLVLGGMARILTGPAAEEEL